MGCGEHGWCVNSEPVHDGVGRRIDQRRQHLRRQYWRQLGQRIRELRHWWEHWRRLGQWINQRERINRQRREQLREWDQLRQHRREHWRRLI